jgi:hypothetical protein
MGKEDRERMKERRMGMRWMRKTTGVAFTWSNQTTKASQAGRGIIVS